MRVDMQEGQFKMADRGRLLCERDGSPETRDTVGDDVRGILLLNMIPVL
jgi:hypothetical protein